MLASILISFEAQMVIISDFSLSILKAAHMPISMALLQVIDPPTPEFLFHPVANLQV